MYNNILVLMTTPMTLVLLQHIYQRFPLQLERLINDGTMTATRYEERKLKHILFWTNDTSFAHEEGQELFLMNNCKINTCYFTKSSSIFNGDLRHFDAILFYGPHMNEFRNNFKLPKRRYPHQKYVYVNNESPENYPECTDKFNGFYNWTATYRLDSDIQLRYVTVRDMHGNIVAPSKKPNWIKREEVPLNVNFNTQIMEDIKTKTKAVAWFASLCKTPVNRKHFIKTLKYELEKHNLTLDIYGECGPFKCDQKNDSCDLMLKKDYFFYLAFEDTFSRDYITEKVFHGYKNKVVPIVHGGADYKRFLPPGSYIDLSFKTIRTLASTMDYLIRNPQEYAKYFWWLPFYRMYDGDMLNFSDASCDLCALLHDEEKFKNHSTYNDFRNWWSPNRKADCALQEDETIMTKLLDVPIRDLFSNIYLTTKRRFYVIEEESFVRIQYMPTIDKLMKQISPDVEKIEEEDDIYDTNDIYNFNDIMDGDTDENFDK